MAHHACVVVTGRVGAGTTALLNQAEYELSSYCVRCVRVHGPTSGGLALRDFIAQVLGRADAAALTDHELKAGFLALTEPGANCDLVALLVAEAHSLLPSAVRYIQLACRSSPKLRVVLAGHPDLATALASDEFAYLRQATRVLELHELTEQALSDSDPAVPEPPPFIQRQRGSSALVRLSLAALLVPMVGFIWWRHVPVSPMARMPVEPPSVAVPAAQTATAEPAATEQERADEVFPPELEPEQTPAPAIAAVNEPPPAHNETPAEAAPEFPSATSGPQIPELPPGPVAPTEDSIAANVEPPAVTELEPTTEMAQEALPPAEAAKTADAVEPSEPAKPSEAKNSTEAAKPVEIAQEAAPAAVQTTEPAEQAADNASSPATAEASGPAAGPILPVPASPRPSRPAAPALAGVQHAHAETPRLAAAAAIPPIRSADPPIRSADQQRCREIVLKTQLGKDLSDGDKRFLRNGCHAG